eukprot:scaffold47_cov258-Pinguiococcus_pyrenoidosus.AAC.114
MNGVVDGEAYDNDADYGLGDSQGPAQIVLDDSQDADDDHHHRQDGQHHERHRHGDREALVEAGHQAFLGAKPRPVKPSDLTQATAITAAALRRILHRVDKVIRPVQHWPLDLHALSTPEGARVLDGRKPEVAVDEADQLLPRGERIPRWMGGSAKVGQSGVESFTRKREAVDAFGLVEVVPELFEKAHGGIWEGERAVRVAAGSVTRLEEGALAVWVGQLVVVVKLGAPAILAGNVGVEA